MKIVLIIPLISFIFSQANYQILSTPSNLRDIFEIDDFYDNYHYSFSNSLFPNDINLFSFTVRAKKIEKYQFFVTLKNLDYGKLTDIMNDYNFSANESLIQFSILKNGGILNKIMLNINYLKSKIDIYKSDAISLDFLTSLKILSHHYFNISFKNSGKIINSYSSTNINLPKTFNLSYNFRKTTSPISFIVAYKKRIDLKQVIAQATLGLKLNKKLNLYLSTTSNKSDLFFGEYIEKILAGTNVGLTYKNNKNNLNLTFQNLGAAGYTTSFSFIRSIL